MRTDEYLWEKIVMPAYREMFKMSKPSADIDEIVKNPPKKTDWFMDYKLSKTTFDKIVAKAIKKCKGKAEKAKVSFELYLGFGPCTKE